MTLYLNLQKSKRIVLVINPKFPCLHSQRQQIKDSTDINANKISLNTNDLWKLLVKRKP